MSPAQIVSMVGSVDIVVSYADGRPQTHIKFDMNVDVVEKLLIEEAQHRVTISGMLLPTLDPLQVANPHEN